MYDNTLGFSSLSQKLLLLSKVLFSRFAVVDGAAWARIKIHDAKVVLLTPEARAHGGEYRYC